MMSGPRVKQFTEGWALPIGSWGKAHYYRRDAAGLAISLCKRSGPGLAGRLLEPGNWIRRKRCEAIARTP